MRSGTKVWRFPTAVSIWYDIRNLIQPFSFEFGHLFALAHFGKEVEPIEVVGLNHVELWS